MNESAQPNPSSHQLKATVVRPLPNHLFEVRGPRGETLTAHLAGSARVKIARLLPGDVVAIEISPLDPSKARIRARISDAPDQGRPTT